jgi:hypothetical protein
MSDDPLSLWDDFEDETDGGENLGRFPTDEDGSYIDAHMGPDADPQEQFYGDLWDAIGIDVDQDFLLDQVTVEGTERFDFGDEDARGPYDRDEVIEFLDDTGWWGIADVYYDGEFDEYYIDINYDDGGTKA